MSTSQEEPDDQELGPSGISGEEILALLGLDRSDTEQEKDLLCHEVMEVSEDDDDAVCNEVMDRLTSNFQGWGLRAGEWREGGA